MARLNESGTSARPRALVEKVGLVYRAYSALAWVPPSVVLAEALYATRTE